jgi:epoxyqueuosine reductase QueG
MNEITEKIKAFFQGNDIPVFGIAPASSLETEPAGYRPSDLLAGATSILCVGIPFPKGVFQAPGKAEQMYWRAAAIYYRHLDAILMRASLVIEETGGTAVPVYG